MMKIQESKYYREIKILVGADDEEIKLVDKHKLLSRSNPFWCLLDDILADVNLHSAGLVIQQERLKDFVKCTDFYSVEYSSSKNKLYESELCYFHNELEVFLLLTSDLTNEYDKQIFENGLYKVKRVYYENTNPKAKENLEKLFSGYLEKYISKEATVSILFKNLNGMDLETYVIKPYRIDLDTMYNDDFKEVHLRVKESLTNDNKGIVLFHGIPGSGKTNYIKWLTAQVPNKKFIFIPTTMISSLTDPSFIGLLVENKNSVLVLEDCENYIAERTSINANTDVVSSILNIADGMLSDVLECQMICTFNSDISKIDSALLRKGRLIAEYKFKELSVEKCNTYLKSIGKEGNVESPQSLAEITNVGKQIKEQSSKSVIGFKK